MLGKVTRIEQLFDQGSSPLNEDNLASAGNLFGVFDGASSLVPDLYQGKTGAWWAAHLVSSEFAKNDASLFELGSRANRKLQLEMTAAGVATSDPLQCWSTSAAVCRLQEDSVEWLQSGDCQILALCVDGECKLLTPYHNHDRSTLQQLRQLIEQNDPEPGRKLRPQIERVRRQMNQTYGVLNGESAALDFLQLGSHALEGICHLLIFTDGLFPPEEDPAGQPDFSWLAEHYRQGGLDQVKQEIRRLEGDDPDCRRYPRFKQHDDIAAMAISFA
jgi:serine/threonine protein phosphatase PrpC